MKDQIINIRVDSELKDQIKHRAESLNLNVSEYLLHCHHFNNSISDNHEIIYTGDFGGDYAIMKFNEEGKYDIFLKPTEELEGVLKEKMDEKFNFEPMKKIEPIDIKYSKVDLVDLKEKHDISYSSLEIEAVNTLADIRSILESDMEDSVKVSIISKIL